MKIEQNTVEVQSNIQYDETHKITIADDDEAVAMVIEKLIGAYKNPYRAVLREYTSNAYDEHVQAGQTSRPVEVSLPSPLSPVLKVQDFGRGLSREQLKGFGTIGKSTKRDSNETTGGFGMGSKSALAASSQFTVTSVQDGKRNTVIVARDEHNIPHMNFLAEAETTDENGTTIIVPISDIGKFGSLDNFWIGWKPGTLLVDDEQPKVTVFDPDRFRTLMDGKAYYDLANVTSGRESIRILINQVYYELAYRDLGLDYKQWNILKHYIVRLDNGTVKIGPSREDLIYDARTKAAIAARMDEILMLARSKHLQDIDAATSPGAALTLMDKMKAFGYPTEGVTWQGKPLLLPGEQYKGNRLPDFRGTWAKPTRASHTKSGWIIEKSMGRLSNAKPWGNSSMLKFVIVHSDGPTTYYSTGRASSRESHPAAFDVADWLVATDASGDYGYDIFITDEPLNRLNKLYVQLASVVIHADELREAAKAVKDARLAEERARRKGLAAEAGRKFRVLTDSRRGVPYVSEMTADEITAAYSRVVFLRNQESGLHGMIRNMMTTKINYDNRKVPGIKKLVSDAKAALILINKSEVIDPYLAVLPPAATIGELAADWLKSVSGTPTKYERMALRDKNALDLGGVTAITEDYLDKIKRKGTRMWVQAVKSYQDRAASVRSEVEWMAYHDATVKAAYNASKGLDFKGLPESPLKRYPLLPAVYAYQAKAEDVVDYINLRDAKIKG